MRVLILVPRLSNPGGIANYYKVLRKFLPDSYEYLERGKNINQRSELRLISDFLKFIKLLVINNYNILVINSSLGKSGFYRDGLYLLLSKTLQIKRITYFRGWNDEFYQEIQKSIIKKYWFKLTFLNSDEIIVLSKSVQNNLIEKGYTRRISLETTLFDENLIAVRNNSFHPSNIFNILFLGNLKKEKGIFEVGYVVKKLQSKLNNTQLSIVGDGPDKPNFLKFCSDNNISYEYFGYKTGREKSQIFQNSHIFILLSYSEGMPNSILEAMAFGLPVISSKVGGIPDFFENGKMGFLIDDINDVENISSKILSLLTDSDFYQKISLYNKNYAKENFYSSKVAHRLIKIIEN